MQYLRYTLSGLTMMVLLTALLGPLGTGPAHANPDFSNNTDILGGQRILLHIDDLAVSFLGTSPGVSDLELSSLPTADGKVQAQNTTLIAATPSVANASPLTLMGRVFSSLNFAVTVTIYNRTYYIHSNATAPTATLLSTGTLGGATPIVAAAMGDFNGDTYADIAVISGNSLFLYTAVDPNDPSKGLKLLASISEDGTLPDGIGLFGLTVGDFNGDGQNEIAGVSEAYNGGGLPAMLLT